MKIMILSDSHTMNKSDLLNLLKANDADYYIHCGDIYMTYNGLGLSNFYICRGNNDFGNLHDDLSITLDNINFFVTHGHHYDVDYDKDSLVQLAHEKGAEVLCFGHTHQPYIESREGVIVINPGSACYARGAYRNPTYCIFDTDSKKVTFYDVKTLEPCDPFTRNKQKKEPLFKKWFNK